MLFECFKTEANDLKVLHPRGMEDETNNLLDAKISFYNQNINAINDKFDLNLRSAGSSIEEIIIEKQIYIKREDDEKITQEIVVTQKITTMEEAIKACKNRGFRSHSSDPLEIYLLDQCIKEFGFTPPTQTYSPATNLKIEKTRKAEVKKQQQAKPAPAPIAQKEEVQPAPVKEVRPAPVKAVQENPTREQPATIPAIKEPKSRTEASSEGKVVCKVDAYGTRICRYEPKMKKNEGALVNNLYLD